MKTAFDLGELPWQVAGFTPHYGGLDGPPELAAAGEADGAPGPNLSEGACPGCD